MNGLPHQGERNLLNESHDRHKYYYFSRIVSRLEHNRVILLARFKIEFVNTLAFRMENQMPQLYICSDIHIQFECPAYHRMCECEHQIWRIDAPDFHFTQGGLYGHIPNSYEAVIV